MYTPLYWIDGPGTGRLAVASRPRGGDWLEEEIRAWQHAGLDTVVSLLTAEEVTELALSDEETWCQVHGVQFYAFPITDRGVPTSRSASVELVRKLDTALTEGKSMVIHCRQGIGRSAVLAARACCRRPRTGSRPAARPVVATAPSQPCSPGPSTTVAHQRRASLVPFQGMSARSS